MGFCRDHCPQDAPLSVFAVIGVAVAGAAAIGLASLVASIIVALEVAMGSVCGVATVALVFHLRRAHQEMPLWQPRRGRQALTERRVRAIGYAVFPAELEAPGEPLEGVVLGADQAARVFRSR